MTRTQIVEISGRSESWLRNHVCAWCDQTLYRALRYGCAAMYEKCDPAKKDFSSKGKLTNTLVNKHDTRTEANPQS